MATIATHNVFADLTLGDAHIAANLSRQLMETLVEGLRTYKAMNPTIDERLIASAAATLVAESVKLGQVVYDAVSN